MKNLKLFLTTTITVLFYTIACNKEKTITNVENQQKVKDIQLLNRFIEENKSPANEFIFNPATGGIFTTLKGTKIYIKPNAFIREDGSTATATIRLHVRDILDPKDMILNDKPTVTTNNEILISFCELFLSAREGTNKLTTDPLILNAVVAKVPLENSNSDTTESVPIWFADTTVYQIVNGLNYEAIPTTVSKPVKLHKGAAWALVHYGGNALVTPKINATQKDTISYTIKNFDVWLNCDQLNFDTRPRAKLFCYFNSNFSDVDTLDVTVPTASNVYYKPKGQNILIKCSNPILNPISTKEGYYTNENLSPIGLDAKFIAFTVKNGKFYAEIKATAIPAPAPGKLYSTLIFNPIEVTESELVTMLNSLKSY